MAVLPYARWGLCSVIPTYVLINLLLMLVSVVCSESLYSADDPLWELDSTNFNRAVLRKNNAWVIEFYNAWCGHCIRFAPTWQAFAKDIQTWRNIIEVAVVNCAESDNIKLCRDYNVNSFPSIKLFWTNLDEQDKGIDFDGDRDLSGLRANTIDFLESEWGRGVPANWPQLDPLRVASLKEMWDELPERISSVSIIVESPESYLGREVILDLSFLKHLTIRRVLQTDNKLVRQLFKNSTRITAPILFKAERNGKVNIEQMFPFEANSTYVRDSIFKTLAGFPRDNQPENELSEMSSKMKGSLPKGPFLRDLENSVSYALSREVGVHQNISGEKLDSLKAYVSTLKTYLPGTPPLMAYLNNVNTWISYQKDGLTGEDFLKQLEKLRTDKEYLPKIKDWGGCKGSQPNYRGYPCSLWMLFHTLTVHAYAMHEADPSNKDPREVLFSIYGYIKYFFTCEECSRHFQEMAVKLKEELHSPEDAVLWLWSAHNKVNRRLAGDASEDPQHKKIQFPPVELCQRCMVEQHDSSQEKQWDTDVVLRFLKRFYGQKNIIVSLKDEGNTNGSEVYLSNELQANEGVNIGGYISETTSLLLLLLPFLFWLNL